MKTIITALIAIALTGCASMDAAHIAGQKAESDKFHDYTDVQVQQQANVGECFKKASTDVQIGFCALLAQGTGMASTFGGRPNATAIAPTTAQTVMGGLEKIVPYAAAASIVRSATSVQAKDPVIVTQPAPLVVQPEVIFAP